MQRRATVLGSVVHVGLKKKVYSHIMFFNGPMTQAIQFPCIFDYALAFMGRQGMAHYLFHMRPAALAMEGSCARFFTLYLAKRISMRSVWPEWAATCSAVKFSTVVQELTSRDFSLELFDSRVSMLALLL